MRDNGPLLLQRCYLEQWFLRSLVRALLIKETH